MRALVLATFLVFAPTVGSAERTWILWGQGESYWSFSLLNIIPGPAPV